MFLNEEEIYSLTKRIHHKAQAKVLAQLGIEHKVRPDGTLVVLASHVERVLGGEVGGKSKKPAAEPNWGALNAARA